MFVLGDNDFVIQEPFTEQEAQDYLDMYGCFDGKKPKKKDDFLNILPKLVDWLGEKDGEKIYKEIVKRIKDSVKEIEKEYPDLTPAIIPDLEDEDEQ